MELDNYNKIQSKFVNFNTSKSCFRVKLKLRFFLEEQNGLRAWDLGILRALELWSFGALDLEIYLQENILKYSDKSHSDSCHFLFGGEGFLTMNFEFEQDHGPRPGPELDNIMKIPKTLSCIYKRPAETN